MKLKTNRKNDGVTALKSFVFAIEVIKKCKELMEQREYVLSKQLLRSGTAIGAIVREAKNGESRKDFIHKLSMAQKEADETIYWIDLLFKADYLTRNEYESLNQQADELMRLLTSTILTMKKKLNSAA